MCVGRAAGRGRRAVGNGDEAQRRKLEELECGCAGLGVRAPSGSASRTA